MVRDTKRKVCINIVSLLEFGNLWKVGMMVTGVPLCVFNPFIFKEGRGGGGGEVKGGEGEEERKKPHIKHTHTQTRMHIHTL